MPPSGQLDCSACGKPNAADMRFCIFCGNDLTGTGAAKASAALSSTMPAPVVCPTCGKADVLNSAFCIYCGSKSGSFPAVQGSTSAGQSTVSSTGLDAVSGEKAPPAPAKRSYAGMVAAIILMAIVGTALGGGGMYYFRTQMSTGGGGAQLPDSGLAIFSAKPYTQVLIALPGDEEKPDGCSYLLGTTSSDGSLCLPNLSTGYYNVSLISDGTPLIQTEQRVQRGQPTVVAEEGSPWAKKQKQ